MRTQKSTELFLFLVAFLVFLTRLPFLDAGFGAEEDAWGLAVTARHTFFTHVYEASRLPGHPLQEGIYAFLWNGNPVVFNVLTALISAAGIFMFGNILTLLKIKNVLVACLALAFTPVYYIASVNDMDYNWALCFILCALYFLLRGKLFLTAFFIGVAAGCRITSGAVLLPFAMYVYRVSAPEEKTKKMLRLVLPALGFCLLAYLPVFKMYGLSFFNYADQFDNAPLIKTLFKASIGVWGTAGCILLAFGIFFAAKNFSEKKKTAATHENYFVQLCILTIALYVIAFLKEPHKSAYFIPIVPFIIFLLAKYCSEKLFGAFTISLILSCFCIGINLADANRSSSPSRFSFSKKISSQQVSFDLLKGALIDDHEKRVERIAFAKRVVEKVRERAKGRALIVTGYWQNYILMQVEYEGIPGVQFVQYIDEPDLKKYQLSGYEIFYLPETDKWNDLAYKKNFTAIIGKPLF